MAAGPPGCSVPLVGDTLNQAEVIISVQLKALVPELVSVNQPGIGLKGPPTPPLKASPAGVTSSASGVASALIRFCPEGVPQPVHKS